jgi:hypothetical protein
MSHAVEVEIERNYAVFKDMLDQLLAEGEGKYALFHDRELRGVFNTAGEAGKAGYANFMDKPFSIQLVSREPVDLGFFSYAPSDR